MATGRPIPYRLSAMNPNRSIAFFDSQFQQQLREQAIEADLRHRQISEDFDCVVSIGLLMVFDCAPGQRIKSFATVIARKPCPANGQPT